MQSTWLAGWMLAKRAGMLWNGRCIYLCLTGIKKPLNTNALQQHHMYTSFSLPVSALTPQATRTPISCHITTLLRQESETTEQASSDRGPQQKLKHQSKNLIGCTSSYSFYIHIRIFSTKNCSCWTMAFAPSTSTCCLLLTAKKHQT